MKVWSVITNSIIIKNFLLAIGILLVVGICLLLWLKSYTNHNKVVTVPNVKGLKVADAVPYLEKAKLRFSVIDSVYRKEAKPGTIVEMIPIANSKVKEDRIVFITINAFAPQSLVVPDVLDMSQRQALALLKATGFDNITVEFVDSNYKDLVLGLKVRGKDLNAGTRVPVSSPLTLVVSSGAADEVDTTIIEQSITPQESEDDSWF